MQRKMATKTFVEELEEIIQKKLENSPPIEKGRLENSPPIKIKHKPHALRKSNFIRKVTKDEEPSQES